MYLKKPLVTAWTDFSKGRLSPVVRGLLKHGVSPESRGLQRWAQRRHAGSLAPLGSAALTMVWSLPSAAKIYRGFKGFGPQKCLQARGTGLGHSVVVALSGAVHRLSRRIS